MRLYTVPRGVRMKVNERRTVVGGGWIGHCVSPQPWREIDAHAQDFLVASFITGPIHLTHFTVVDN